MREFVYFSGEAATSGNFDVNDLMKAGRMDIAVHFIINSFFLSHNLRDDVKLHLIFYGMPDPPKHIEIQITPETKLSKKDVANLIKRILYKYKKNGRSEVLPGCFVEKKSFLKVIEGLENQGKKLFILDRKGESIRKIKIPDESIFIVGDQNGFPKKELKRLKKMSRLVSVGPKVYFASQVVTLINNELDLRGF